jgi:hypothetical protein
MICSLFVLAVCSVSMVITLYKTMWPFYELINKFTIISLHSSFFITVTWFLIYTSLCHLHLVHCNPRTGNHKTIENNIRLWKICGKCGRNEIMMIVLLKKRNKLQVICNLQNRNYCYQQGCKFTEQDMSTYK